MRLYGTVQGVNPKGDVIVKPTMPQKLRNGERVFDKRGKPIGTVKRIFGPVKSPYVSIKQKRHKSSSGLKGKELYIND
jgi:rRNA processing protein Gar1